MTTRRSALAEEAPLLEVTDLHTSFRTERGRVRAVDGVSFTLRRGEALGIVGESGSGKSVLSRTIMGLLPDSAEVSGSVRFAGREILDLSPEQRRHLWGSEMSMVFQNPLNSLNPVMRIGRQITEPLRLHLGMDRSNAERTAIRLLRDVHIPEPERRLRQYPHELSGGMRQRVMIAMALACGPTLLIADEPTTALDVTVQAQILQVVNEQRVDRDMSLVLVTHDLGIVAGHTDRVAVMYGGRLVELAPTASLFADMKMPYTRALVRSIPRLDDPSHTRLDAIPGRPPDLVDAPSGCPFTPRCPEARDRCATDRPELETVAGGEHHYACWFPLDRPEEGR
jgi:oligopeptide/dipeptide ABC transporter ATP-binding protein